MSKHHFFFEPDRLSSPTILLPNPLAHRIGHILRLAPGDRIALLDGSGLEVEAEIESLSRNEVVAREVGRSRPGTEPPVHITLYQALLPAENFEWALEKGTEIGVSAFVPLVTERCTARPSAGDKARERKRERRQAVVTAAAEQIHRVILPRVEMPLTLTEALATAPGELLMAWEESSVPPRKVLQALADRRPAHLSLFIGPEGGFAEGEVELAQAHGAAQLSLGPRVLKAETAGLVLAALALYQLTGLEPTP